MSAAALREIRVALLEADVALPVVRDFVAAVREKAIGQEVLRSVTPAQMVVKIVHDHLVEVLGGEARAPRAPGATGIDLNAPPPVAVMLVGLQGSGKTTTAAKIALRLKQRERKKVLMASLDVQRPAAQEQLAAARPPDRRHDACRSCRASGRSRSPGARCRSGRTEGYDVVHARHRRPAPRQRGADARSRGGARGGQPARDLARRRRDDRAGRGQCRQGVWRARRHHRRSC